jgi:hypothetical protein
MISQFHHYRIYPRKTKNLNINPYGSILLPTLHRKTLFFVLFFTRSYSVAYDVLKLVIISASQELELQANHHS